MIVNYVLNTIIEMCGKKWRIVVLYHLKNDRLRFSQIRKLIPEVSVKVLSEVLKDLEENQLIIREQFPGIPTRVEYSINPAARELIDLNYGIAINGARFLLAYQVKLKVSSKDVIAMETFLSDMAPML